MKIEDLQETAALAHLRMEAEELAGAFPAFEQMLGYFAAMQAAGEDRAAFPEDAAVIANFSAARNVSADHFRSDNPFHNPQDLNDRPLNSDLLNNAGDRDGLFIVVPNVL
ncbi:MAG: aspartyl/glutamyl-tRNA amidotransferase subunit C [Treponema sp.]|jgi:aspartyl-tRNA(Asn)/glutamyl-tRNA(Gln) amidotransferase subunit C|nr:aspartyl/glutamyl-tRNA amidotransferase subunit C [Treponema sp.]